MLGYTIRPPDLNVSVQGGHSSSPLRISANHFDIKTARPYGIVAINGEVYSLLPEKRPTLFVYEDGGADVKETYTASEVANARFAVGGTQMIVRHREAIKDAVDPKILAHKAMPRMGVATTLTGELLFLVVDGTFDDLQTAFMQFKVYDAMMLAYENIYVNDVMGGIMMGTQPLTVLEASKVKPLAKPVVVIDPGHGGVDPGAIGYGVQEKNLNLFISQEMQRYLSKNYEGTFVLIRNDDATIELNDRPVLANKLGADFYFASHVNSAPQATAHGYESFTYLHPSAKSEEVRSVVHDTVMQFLRKYNIADRGKKQANLCVVRETKMPAMLVENLFISNPDENKLLKDQKFLTELADVTAEGLAKGLKLGKKLTTPDKDEPDVLYTVQVGSYAVKANADDMVNKLTKAGFIGAIVTEKKKG